jgi:hypothetical protein
VKAIVFFRRPARTRNERKLHHFVFYSRRERKRCFRGFSGIFVLNAASPVGVMWYVQPNILSCLRRSQPLESMLTIVDGPAG